MLILTAVN